MKKILIKKEGSFPAFIIGISSQYQDFQVAWAINNALKRNLSKAQSISIRYKRKEIVETYSFSMFSYFDLDENYFYLITNKENEAVLYNKYKNIDFFLIVQSNEISLDEVIKKISKEDVVNGSFLIPVNNVFKKIINQVIDN